jgi:hypothetical protein
VKRDDQPEGQIGADLSAERAAQQSGECGAVFAFADELAGKPSGYILAARKSGHRSTAGDQQGHLLREWP